MALTRENYAAELEQRHLQEGDAVFLRDGLAGIVWRDDRDPVRGDVDMAQDQRQDTLSDAAEAEHQQAAGKCGVLGHDAKCTPWETPAAPAVRPSADADGQ